MSKCNHEDYDEYFAKCFGCKLDLVDIIRQADSEDEARQGAMYWQDLFRDESMSYSELAEWATVFRELGAKFNLTDEFQENGIL